MSFDESKQYVRKLGISTTGDWKKYVRSGKKPHNLPSQPYREYKEKWLSFPDWFGTKPGFNGKYKSFEEAREYVRKLKFKSTKNFKNMHHLVICHLIFQFQLRAIIKTMDG